MASVTVDVTTRLMIPGTGFERRSFLRSSRLGWLAPWLFCFSLLFAELTHGVQLIAHESVPVKQLSLKELRAIYTMRLNQWSNDLKVQVFVLPQQNDIHQRFSKNILQVLPHQLQAAWYRLVYSGMGRGPIEVQDQQAMIERVGNTPGAI